MPFQRRDDAHKSTEYPAVKHAATDGKYRLRHCLFSLRPTTISISLHAFTLCVVVAVRCCTWASHPFCWSLQTRAQVRHPGAARTSYAVAKIGPASVRPVVARLDVPADRLPWLCSVDAVQAALHLGCICSKNEREKEETNERRRGTKAPKHGKRNEETCGAPST